MQLSQQLNFHCANGMGVRRHVTDADYVSAIGDLAQRLDSQQGVLLASSFEYPGRYTRWDIGFVNPPIMIVARGRRMEILAQNRRGEILLPELVQAVNNLSDVAELDYGDTAIELTVGDGGVPASEEKRSRQPSVFSVLRALIAAFASDEDAYLGLYGAFGYDLTFQFEDVERQQRRQTRQRDLVLYLPDQIFVVDHRIQQARCFNYEFICRGWSSQRRCETTGGLLRSGKDSHYVPAESVPERCDHRSGEYVRQVRRALEYFRRGDLFEVVPGQTFFEPSRDKPSTVFTRLRQANPAPYGALMNLGEKEYLIAASPEMFVRVAAREIESCPISGTIKRGEDALGDARQIKALLNSAKDEAELSMCTDVDRNDKARVCVPDTIRVVGRRQIELYSKLIHTVDHVKGRLADGFDALDGFLAHTWAVTVTGAPKHAAMQYLERYEKSPRHWYGGALGYLGFNGEINTGLTLRTIRIQSGIAEVRAGATLMSDSDPQAEERETRLKAAALLDAVRGRKPQGMADAKPRMKPRSKLGAGLAAIMIDHQDSFVHSLTAYFRQCGVSVTTLRPEAARTFIKGATPDLVILSPGPGRPSDFALAETIDLACAKQLPIFGVCLGLQGLVEYFGGSLGLLPDPMHGKPSLITHYGHAMFAGIDRKFTAGRYHSLVTKSLPDCLQATAHGADGSVMAIAHRNLPVTAVQFHPESIMSQESQAGMRLIENSVGALVRKPSMAACDSTSRQFVFEPDCQPQTGQTKA